MRAVLVGTAIVIVAAVAAFVAVPTYRRGSGGAQALLYLTVAAAVITGLAALPLLLDDGAGASGIAVVTDRSRNGCLLALALDRCP